MMGVIDRMSMAEIFHHRGAPEKVNPEMKAGRVLARLKLRERANKSSFQENIKQKMPVATRPGVDRGRTILTNAPNKEQPST